MGTSKETEQCLANVAVCDTNCAFFVVAGLGLSYVVKCIYIFAHKGSIFRFAAF